MEGWTAINWDQERPTKRDLRRSHQRLQFEAAEIADPNVTAVVNALDTLLTNGGAVAARFTVRADDDTAQWFLSRNRLDEYGLSRCLLASPAMREALPNLTDVRLSELDLHESDPLLLDGEIACTLTWGGAYRDFDGCAAQAKELGLAFTRAVIGDRYEDFHVDRTSSAWSSWFRGLVWDQTWIITDRRHRTVLLFCATDIN